MDLKQKIISLSSAFGITAAALLPIAANEAQADPNIVRDGPYITVEHTGNVEVGGGQRERTVNCGEFLVMPKHDESDGPPLIWANAAVVQQIDSNGQDIIGSSIPDPRSITTLDEAKAVNLAYDSVEEAQQHISTTILRLTLLHLQNVHSDCINPQNAAQCSLNRAVSACYAALDLR